jgi:hypothetical protein
MGIADDDQALVPYLHQKHFPNMTFVTVASYKHALLYVCDGVTRRVAPSKGVKALRGAGAGGGKGRRRG